MKSASSTYKTLRTNETSWYEWRVLQGANTYGLDKLKSLEIIFALTTNSGIDIGNANSAECRMTLLEESANWQRMAAFTVQFRNCLGSTTSEWITLGKFYTDERSEDTDGNLSIIAFDAMLKMEQTWADKIPEQYLPASYPITARAWATMVQSANLATFTDINLLDDSVAFVGLNTTATIRDVLKSIAAVHAGNWVVLPNENLSLIPYRINTGKNLLPKYTGSATASGFSFVSNTDGSVSLTDGSATATSTRTSSSVSLEAGTYYVSGCPSGGSTSTYQARVLSGTSGSTVLVDETGSGATFTLDAAGSVRYQIRIVSGTTTNGLTFYPMICKSTDTHNYESYADDLIDLAKSEQSLETSPALPAVTGTHLETEMGTVMEAGNATGYVVKAICDVSSTTGVPELCLSKISGYVFHPIEAGTAYLDPLVDIGDSVKVDGTFYQILSIDWALGKKPTADISAPYDKEIDHEYTVPNQSTKTYRKAMSLVDEKMGDYVPWDEFATAIEQNEQAVVIAASHTYVTQNVYDAQIAEIQSQIDGSIQTWSGNAVPTLSNAPAVDWITPTEKAEHVGDTYFVNSDAGIPEAGSYYRFEVNNGVYSWQLLTDSALTEALAQAAAALAAAEDAQDTADASYATAHAKGKIYVVQPTPPYNVGDLWFNDTNSVIKVCMTARASGSYVASDWVKRDKYIDEIDLETYLADSPLINSLQDQIDQKAETYYQSADPSINWGVHPVGVAIAGLDTVGISGVLAQQHTGDLWYKTTDNTTWYFNGNTWEQQDVPEEVFDKIDGKAQVFVSEPYAPYNVGDLWFNSATSDIKTCIRARTTSGFAESDWEKRDKYTDDTATNALREEVTSEFTVQSAAISAKVSRTGGTNSTFGWVLNDTSHTWYADNQAVMSISHQNGLVVKGNITATSGYIGNGSSGFEITSTAIRNGMTSLTDTSHTGVYIGTNGIALGQGKFKVTSAGELTARSGYIGNGSSGFTIGDSSIRNGMTSLTDTTNNGVYIGTNGIALGKGAFKVTSAGAITATSGSIGGFTISGSSLYTSGQSSYSGTGNGIYIGSSGLRIGSGFKVDNAGNLYATSGTFSGNVYASNIQYGSTGGYLNGGAISSGTIYGGGSGGQIAPYTLSDYNVAQSGGYGAYTTAAFSSGVQGSLGYADLFKYATQSGTSTYPSLFKAGYISAVETVTARDFTVSSSGGSETNLSNHYHTITVGSDGKVTFGRPYNSTTPPSFNIADTETYKTNVLASRAVLYCNASNYSSFSSGYDCDLTGSSYYYSPSGADYSYGRIDLRNSYGNSLKTIRVKMPTPQVPAQSISATTGLTTNSSNYTTYDRAVGLGSSSVYVSGSSQYGRVKITLGDGGEQILRVSMPSATVSSITSKSTAYDNSDYYYDNGWKLYVHAKDSGGNTLKTDSVDVQFAVDYGASQGGNISWVQIMSSDYSLANKVVALYCYNSNNQLVYSNGNVRITYDDR